MSAPLVERAYIGALMHLSAARVNLLGTLVRESDLSDPRLRIIYAGVLAAASAGDRPNPAIVDARLRDGGMVRASDSATLAALLVDLYHDVPIPDMAETYGRTVMAQAVRRRVTEAVDRLAAVAEKSDLEALIETVATEALAMVVECKRLEAAPLAVVA